MSLMRPIAAPRCHRCRGAAVAPIELFTLSMVATAAPLWMATITHRGDAHVVYPMSYNESNAPLTLLTLTVIHSSSYNNGISNAVNVRAPGDFSAPVGDQHCSRRRRSMYCRGAILNGLSRLLQNFRRRAKRQ